MHVLLTFAEFMHYSGCLYLKCCIYSYTTVPQCNNIIKRYIILLGGIIHDILLNIAAARDLVSSKQAIATQKQ